MMSGLEPVLCLPMAFPHGLVAKAQVFKCKVSGRGCIAKTSVGLTSLKIKKFR